MSLVDDLMAEKQEKALGALKKKAEKQEQLDEIKNVTVKIENPTNDIITEIVINQGKTSRTDSPSSDSYKKNIKNKKIGTILSKYGNLEI